LTATLALATALCSGCDQDVPKPPGPAASVHLIGSNLSSGQLPANGRIQLAFDRLLLPSSITRQTFILEMNTLTPTVAYDPVTRVVTITPTSPLTPGQTYSLGVASPQSATDPYGLRAIDGATLDPKSPSLFEFQVTAAAPAPSPAPTIDFCNDVFTPTLATCGGAGCHGSALPAAGLLLTTTTGVEQTAVDRVARGSNTGPRAASEPPGLLFGEDMPIIDPGTGGLGDPGNSWLLYKMLMALPDAAPTSSCDGGTAMDAETATDAGAETPDAGAEGGAADATVSADATSNVDGATALADGGAGEAGAADDAGGDAAVEAASPATPTALTSVCGVYQVSWQPLSSPERAALAGLVPGREMPYPTNPDSGPGKGVSVDALERLSLWITQGATIPSGGCH
jgi:hypothetical protein